jgi:hypothetical protein
MTNQTFSYFFTRRIFGQIWTIQITGHADGKVDFDFQTGLRPHWRTGLLSEGAGALYCDFRVTRLLALRFAVCALRNVASGFCMASANNQPDHPHLVRPVRAQGFNVLHA